jgi:hypothetical protein
MDKVRKPNISVSKLVLLHILTLTFSDENGDRR